MEKATTSMADLREKGYSVHAVYNNAYARDSYQTMIDTVIEKEDHINILVNNFITSNPQENKTITDTNYDTPQHQPFGGISRRTGRYSSYANPRCPMISR